MIATGPKETVIVVHGSFDAPVGDNKKWFELSEADSDNPNFTTLLDQALIRRGTVARCWAHCERGDQIFSWSGANSWVDRAIASQKLRDLVLTLVEDGWVCHLVGHSHGGNIIADAIPEIIERVDITRSRVITLGTPFINIFESIEQAKKRLSLLYSLSAAAAVIFLLLLLKWLDSDVREALIFSILFANSNIMTLLSFFIGPPILFSFLALLAFVIRIILHLIKPRMFSVAPNVLVINTSQDEVWQLLQQVRMWRNTFIGSNGLWGHICERYRNSLQIFNHSYRLHGGRSIADLGFYSKGYFLLSSGISLCAAGVLLLTAASFSETIAFFVVPPQVFGCFLFGRTYLSTLLTPWRLLSHHLGALYGIPVSIADYVVRRSIGPILQSQMMGLEGYPYECPIPTKCPSKLPACTYEDLPNPVIERALIKRNQWIELGSARMSVALSQETENQMHLPKLLEIIAEDATLVHSIYYRDIDTIERVADWISIVQ